jgi:flagellum-specific ATP synthase
VSRVANRVTSREQQAVARALRGALAARRNVQDLLDVGAYAAGSNPRVDAAVAYAGEIEAFLRQDMDDVTPTDEAWQRLAHLVGAMGID